MENTIGFILCILVIITMTYAFTLIMDKDQFPYRYIYKCSHCSKKFKESDLKDLQGPWHTKEWTCPHCKHQNVTTKRYNHDTLL